MTPIHGAGYENGATTALGAMTRHTGKAILVLGALAATDMTTSREAVAADYGPLWTNAGQSGGAVTAAQIPTTSSALMEIRRLAGLTWQEMGDLFGVSRRSIHHWVSGKPLSAGHERRVRVVLGELRRVDAGSAQTNRDRLFTVSEGRGDSLFERLQAGETSVVPASGTEILPMRRPPQSRRGSTEKLETHSPFDLMETLPGRPPVKGKARGGRLIAKRSRSGKTG